MNSYTNHEGIAMNIPVRQVILQFVLVLIILGLSAGVEAATLTVTNFNDAGAGSLRQAVLDAAAGDTVDFAAGITPITLTTGEIVINKSLTINGSNARNLTISGGGSSRIFNITSGTVVINGVTLTNGNAPTNGGAISNAGILTLNKVAITGNSAPSTGPPGNGGGIYNFGTITMNSVTVSGNSANSAGGGIYNDSNPMVINNSTISGNASFDGGGIYNYSGGSSLTINNSTITNNTTTNINSAALDHDFGMLLSIYNTILAGNATADLLATLTPPTLVHNSVVGVVVGTLGTDTAGNLPAPANLGPLANNGGPTDTHAPLAGSPALNAGDATACLATDQRGITRPLPASCDIGAVEPTCKWTNAGGGSWSAIGNWDCGHVPDGADHTGITLPGTYTVNLDQAASVLDMILGAASGTQTLSVTLGVDSSLYLNGASTIAAGGLLSVANSGSQVGSSGLLTNNGGITLNDSTFLVLNLKNSGTLTVTGANPSTLDIGAFASANSGTITANSPFNITMTSTGSYTNTGTMDTGAGNSIVLDGTGLGSFTNSGIIMGSGTVDVTLVGSSTFNNSGEIKPATLGTNGLLSFTGSMNMTAANLYIDISGAATPGTDYDQVAVSGAAAINGTLNVALNSYNPPAGSSFTIMTCGSGCDSGAFTPNLPTLTGGKVWTVAYNPASIVLNVANETIAPTDNGTLSTVAGDGQVSLSWTAATDSGSGVASYLLEFSTSTTPAAGCSGGSNIGNVTSFTHSGAVNGTTYYYRLCAKDAAGNISTGLTAVATPFALLSQSIGTISFTPATIAVGGSTTASAVGGGSGNPVIFSSATPSVCTVSGTNGSTITIVSAGTCTIAANQAGDASYYAAPMVSQNLTIAKATPVITWPNPAGIIYGTALGATQLNATSGGVPGSFVYSPASGTVLNAGSAQTLTVTFIPTDTAGYNTPGAVSVLIDVAVASQTISFDTAPILTYGGASGTVIATASSGLPAILSSLTPLVCTISGSTVTPVSAGSCSVAADQLGNGNYTAAPQVTQNITVAKAALIITAAAANKIYGTADPVLTYTYSGLVVSDTLSGSLTRAAGENVGSYAIEQGAVSASAAGNYAVTFVPANLNITKATPVITWTAPAAITYGTPLSATQLNAGSGGVAGTFAYTPPIGTILSVGAGQTLSVAFTPSDPGNYTAQAATVSLTVNPLSANQFYTGPDGRTTVPISMAVSGASLSLAAGTLLTDASGNPISGTLTVTAAVMNSIASLPAGLAATPTSTGGTLFSLGNSITITISSGSTTVKHIAPPMTVNLAIPSTYANPGDSVSYYSFDGTTWTLEGTAIVKPDGTVDMLVGHLSVWAVATFNAPQLADALKSLNFAMKTNTPTPEELMLGDVAPLVNGVSQPDGEINLGDTIVILRRVVGL
ncbi:MAG: choice-of-anchor Q domain-containing protein [Pelobacteraceae bacterium]